MSIKNKKSNKNRLMFGRILIITVIVLAFAVLAAFIYNRFLGADSRAEYASNTGTINYDPPTPEERQAGDNKKEEIAKEQENPAPSPPPGAAAVTITYGGLYNDAVEVGAYVSNVIEDGGTCKLSLTQGSQTVTATTTAVSNARTTDCPTLSVKKNQLASGIWKAVVTYTSSGFSGASAVKEITIQ